MLKNIGRTDAEAEAPTLWLPEAKNWLIGEKTWCWERLKAGREGDKRGWDGFSKLQVLVMACCSPCGHKESDVTEWLNWTELNCHIIYSKGKRLRQNHFGSLVSVKKEDQGYRSFSKHTHKHTHPTKCSSLYLLPFCPPIGSGIFTWSEREGGKKEFSLNWY